MSKEAVTVAVGADVSPLDRALSRAKKIVADATNEMQNGVVKTSKKGKDLGQGWGDKAGQSLTKILDPLKSIEGPIGNIAKVASAIPGIGIAAVGFGVALAGANLLREHFEKMAEFAKTIKDNQEKIKGLEKEGSQVGMTALQIEEDKLNTLKEQEASLNKSLAAKYADANKDTASAFVKTGVGVGSEGIAEDKAKLSDIAVSRLETENKIKKLKLDQDESDKDSASRNKKEESDKRGAILKQVLDGREKAEFEAKTNEQKLAALDEELKMRGKLTDGNLENELAIQKALEKRKAILDEISQLAKQDAAERDNEFKKEQDAEQELADAQIANAKAKWTDRQKFIALVREGRKAQKDADANPSDVKALTKLTKLRGEYNEMLRNAPTKEKKEKVDLDAGDRNEKGKIVGKNGGIVSQEDRDRSRATSVKAEAEAQKTRAQAIGETGKIGESKPAADASGEALKGISTGVEDLNSQLKNLINKFN